MNNANTRHSNDYIFLALFELEFIKFALIIHKRITKNDEQHILIPTMVIVTIAKGRPTLVILFNLFVHVHPNIK